MSEAKDARIAELEEEIEKLKTVQESLLAQAKIDGGMTSKSFSALAKCAEEIQSLKQQLSERDELLGELHDAASEFSLAFGEESPTGEDIVAHDINMTEWLSYRSQRKSAADDKLEELLTRIRKVRG